MSWRRPPPVTSTPIEVWGADPFGSDQAYAVVDSINGHLANQGNGTPAGWGLAGSVEQTDSQLWASPQAFNGGAGPTAQFTLHPGGGAAILYDAETDYDFDVVTIPDQITVGT